MSASFAILLALVGYCGEFDYIHSPKGAIVTYLVTLLLTVLFILSEAQP
jgi:hypothetical protein